MKSILSLVNFKDNRKSGSSCLRRGIRDERSGEIGIIPDVQERAMEGVGILLNDVWHSEVIDFGFVSS